jgi:chloramphenicol 3-O phosphotransferase
MKKGKIIFLNGVASAGKTSLAKTLQSRLSEPYYWLNVDAFITFSAENPMEYNPSTYFEEGKDPVSLYPHIIKLYSDLGVNVIADAAFTKGQGRNLFLALETLEKCIEMLHEYPLLYVHVTCPLEEMRRREEERGYRNIGQSEDQLMEINPYDIYDITVDTFQNTKEECADKIIELLEEPEKHTAFRTLRYNAKMISLLINYFGI